MTEVAEDVHPDKGIYTAVGFLNDVAKQNWNEADLRRYLLGTRGLSNTQVKEAFRIHRTKSGRRSIPGSRGNINIILEEGKALASPNSASGSADRPERKISTEKDNINSATSNNLSYLMLSKKNDGEQLIDEFLICEKGYCGVLECLNDEYLRELYKQAGRGTIKLGQDELHKMFFRITHMLNFHKCFYADLLVGSNIGRLFIRRFSFFKGYGEYLKDATAIIDMLRKHIFDKSLLKCVETIRKRSRMASNDFTDLLLTPLDRIMDYQIFLSKLHEWADQTQAEQYQFFAKAVRRVGRIAKYIDTYKHAVINRSEMNRVQQYLGNRCSVIQPHRSIIRRGVITRRTTGWTARNKKYHFFLFTDILLWTTKAGVVKNIVKLLWCQLMPSDVKNDYNRKFKIYIDLHKKDPMAKKKSKMLLLECKSEEQKEEWYRALENAIKAITKTEGLEDELDYAIENESDETEFSKRTTIREDSFLGGSKLNRENGSEDWGSQTLTSETRLAGAYHERYKSRNFIEQKFEEFQPMDDTESECSDYDHSFYDKFGAYDKVWSQSSMSPHQKPSHTSFEDQKTIGKKMEQEIRDDKDVKLHNTSSCVIKRRRESFTNKSSSVDEIEPVRVSSFTLRLSDEMSPPEANFVISLSRVEDVVYLK